MHDSHSEADESVNDDLEAEGTTETDGLDAEAPEPAPDDAETGGEVLEDVVHEGRTYQVPRALKGAFLMHADYTRKTQELAEERRAVEAERAGHAQSAEARAGLAALEHKLSALEAVDWTALRAEDPQAAERLLRHAQELAEARDHLAGELDQWEQRRAIVDQQDRAAKLREGQAVLERDLAGWSPQLAQQLAAFAVNSFGVTPEELADLHDPRLVKLLHAAYVGANARGANRQAQRHADAQASRPAATVGGRAAAGKDPSRMTTDEWMRHRNKQLRALR